MIIMKVEHSHRVEGLLPFQFLMADVVNVRLSILVGRIDKQYAV